MNDTIRHDKDGGFTVIPEKVMEPLKTIENTDLIHGVISSLSDDLNSKLETFVIEGLKRKGFEFRNELELENFLKQRCRCEDNVNLKQRTYFVDDKPFFLHDYNIEMDLTPIIEDGKTTLKASYGSFAYL